MVEVSTRRQLHNRVEQCWSISGGNGGNGGSGDSDGGSGGSDGSGGSGDRK